MYDSMLVDGPQCIICHTFGQSKPIANAIVLITICKFPFGLPRDSRIASLTSASVHRLYMSTKRYFERSGAEEGLVKLGPRYCLNSEYIAEHWPHCLQNMIILGMYLPTARICIAMHCTNSSRLIFCFTVYTIFFLCGVAYTLLWLIHNYSFPCKRWCRCC